VISKPQIRPKGKASCELKTERINRGWKPLPHFTFKVGAASCRDQFSNGQSAFGGPLGIGPPERIEITSGFILDMRQLTKQ